MPAKVEFQTVYKKTFKIKVCSKLPGGAGRYKNVTAVSVLLRRTVSQADFR